jgi:hypothetical protein
MHRLFAPEPIEKETQFEIRPSDSTGARGDRATDAAAFLQHLAALMPQEIAPIGPAKEIL